MNDTQPASPESETPSLDPIAQLAAMDPADTPAPFESYAQLLTDELEQAGASAPVPEQLSADLEMPEG